ncbi:MAG: Ig-like domain-containing protein [Eubacterium sp.]|nr:Ig-like domain-containing protein [Eubacterium sp.]
MKRLIGKKWISIVLSILLAVSGMLPAFTALAGDGVIEAYELEIFYKDSNTMVPTYDDEESQTEHIEYIPEGKTVQYTYQLIDCQAPDNSYIKWYSENPVLVDTDQTGKVKAFDSSKGAVIQSWIDNEVKPIPIIGSTMGTVFEKAFFNDYVNLDSLDSDAIVEIMVAALGSSSALADYAESYKGQLVDSLREYLDKVNTPVYCQLFSSDGKLLAEDHIDITVTRCEEWYANFLPNGTHITNKSTINTTQAKGNTVQLHAITTPQRLQFGVVYSVKSSSIFSQGKVVATVNDSGLVTFKNTGKATILVSPDSEEVIEAILKMVNYVYALDNTGTLDTSEIAGVLIDYMGVDMNRTVLTGLLDAAFAIKDIAGDAADPVQLTATAVEIIANIVLQMAYNDSITFEVVQGQPITNFKIDGVATVREGSEIQLSIIDVEPEAGDKSDITWSSSHPEIASVDPQTGVIKGLDSGGALGQLSSQTAEITATSAANNVSKTVTVTVTGKTGRYISHIDIVGDDIVEIDGQEDYSYSIYPSRVANAENLYIKWGMKTGENENGEPIYSWADEGTPVTDGIGKIYSNGHYETVGGGYCTIACMAYTGYELANGSFYEISNYIATKEVRTGIPVENIRINVTGGTSNGDINRNNTITINGVDYQYVTIKKNVMEAYAGNGANLSATVYPSDATDQHLNWVVDNGYYNTETSDDTHSISVKQKAGHEVADTFNIYAVSNDGKIKSNVITVCVTRNYVTSNTIDQQTIILDKGETKGVTHTVGLEGSWTTTAYACYKCNWYSGDEAIFTVKTDTNDNRDGIVTAHDVGEATLYCVSADGGITGTARVIVRPDKTYLKKVIELCEDTVILRTSENKDLYKKYMKQLDLAYTVYYDEEMASQATVDTAAQNLLSAFFKLGGFVGVNEVDIVGTNGADIGNKHVTVDVGTTTNYTKYSYDFDYKINPKAAMYSSINWTSSTSAISVDSNGVCTPTSNSACSAIITCIVEDYSGRTIVDKAYISFARTRATGLSLDTNQIYGGKVGESQKLVATVSPTGISSASCNSVLWETSDDEIATVDGDGTVHFLRGGDCVITCTSVDGGFTAECAVNVVTNYDALQNLITQYNDLNLKESSYYPDTWDTYTAAKSQAEAMVSKHEGYSQNQVDAMYATLEAAYNGLKKYVDLQGVELYLDGSATSDFYQYDLSLLSEGLSYKNAELDLNVRLYPNNASYATVDWVSSTSDISVDSEGKAKPTANKSCYGRITCTVTDHFGRSFSDYVWVSFAYSPVTGMQLSENNIYGSKGTTYQLNCTVQPDGTSLLHINKASIQDYYWESDDESIATVDENGLVSFVGAGSTIIRVVSYDGGKSAECVASTEGDRSQLRAALEQYADVDYMDYEYEYGQAFKKAYNEAEEAMTDMTLDQDEIDSFATALEQAGAALALHPFVDLDSFNITFQAWKDPPIVKPSMVTSGTVSGDSLSVNISSGYADANYNNYIILNAAAVPANTSYKTLSWSVSGATKMDSSISGTQITLTPTEKTSAGKITVTITATDLYGRTVKRSVNVVMADKTVSGLTLSSSSITKYATDNDYTVNANVASASGTPDVTEIIWTSSDENVVTVNNGVLHFVDTGMATVTAQTFDGGKKATVQVEVLTNFQILADKVEQYRAIVNAADAELHYTEESLGVLSAACDESDAVVREGKASQTEVNAYLAELNAAYEGLVEYILPTSVTLTVKDGQNGVTTPNPGYVRKTATTLTGASIEFDLNIQPSNALIESIEWISSNSAVLANDGMVSNTVSGAKASKITVRVTAFDGSTYTTSVNVSFTRYPVNGISFDEELVYGAPNTSVALQPKLNVGDAIVSSSYVSTCSYKSSNESIATVNNNGVVTFVGNGECTITATSDDGGHTATIRAYTTCDTTALAAAVIIAEQINYKDYAYTQGMAFKAKREAAQAVLDNAFATQAEVDAACFDLNEAMTALEEHEFIAPDPTITVGDKEIASGGTYETIDGKTTIAYTMNEGAMIKSSSLSFENVKGATVKTSGNTTTVTKTATTATMTVKFTAVTDYDDEVVKTYNITLVNQIINITDFTITVDGTAVPSGEITKSGYGTGYSNFEGLQLGYTPTPANADAPKSVEWSLTSNYMKISDSGLVTLTTRGKLRPSSTATATCTITNNDNTTVTKSITITIAT